MKSKIKTRKVKVLRSINAPYLSNCIEGDTVDVPRGLYEVYLDKGLIEPVRKTKTDKKKIEKIEENGD